MEFAFVILDIMVIFASKNVLETLLEIKFAVATEFVEKLMDFVHAIMIYSS